MAKWLIQVVLITITLKLCVSRDSFLSSPTSVNTTYNAEVKFSCKLNLEVISNNTKAAWEFEIESITYDVTDAPFSDGISSSHNYETFNLTIFINISTPINETKVYCKTAPINSSIPLDGGIRISGKATLLVQGLPDAIEEIYTEQENNWIYFYWDPPNSLHLTDTSLDTKYCVSVTRIKESSIYNVTRYLFKPPLITVTSHNYTFPEDATPCDMYELTITSHNGPEGSLTGGKRSLNFHRYKEPRKNSTFNIDASFDNGTFEANINFDEDIQACTDNCEAEAESDTGTYYLNALNGLNCSSNQATITTRESGPLNFSQGYNFTITIRNSAGSAEYYNIILYISADIISAAVNKSDEFLSLRVTAIFTRTSESVGTYILLQQYFQDPASKEENCGNGIQTNFGQKNGNDATVSFNNLSEGEYDLYLLPLNVSNKISSENGQLSSFKYLSRINISYPIGQGSFSNRSSWKLSILNSNLNVKELRNNMALIIIQKFSSSNSTSLIDSQVIYTSGQESNIEVKDLKNEMNVCLSIYLYKNGDLFGAERSWSIISPTETSLQALSGLAVLILVILLCLISSYCCYKCCKKKSGVVKISNTENRSRTDDANNVQLKEIKDEQTSNDTKNLTKLFVTQENTVQGSLRNEQMREGDVAKADTSSGQPEPIHQNAIEDIQSKPDSTGIEITNSTSQENHWQFDSCILDMNDSDTEDMGASGPGASDALKTSEIELKSNLEKHLKYNKDKRLLNDEQSTSYSEMQPTTQDGIISSQVHDSKIFNTAVDTEIENRTARFTINEQLKNVERDKTWKKKSWMFYSIQEMERRWSNNVVKILRQIKGIENFKLSEAAEHAEELLVATNPEKEEDFRTDEAVLKFLAIISNVLNQYKRRKREMNIILWEYKNKLNLNELAKKEEGSCLPYIVVNSYSEYKVGLCYNGIVVHECERVFDCILDWVSFNINYNFKKRDETNVNAVQETLLDIISRVIFDIELCEKDIQTDSLKLLRFSWL